MDYSSAVARLARSFRRSCQHGRQCRSRERVRFGLPFSDLTPTEREYVCGGPCRHPTETAQPATSGPHAEGRARGRCRGESGSDPAVPGSGSSADVLFSSSKNTNSNPHVKTSVARTNTGLQSTVRTVVYSYHVAESFEYRVLFFILFC